MAAAASSIPRYFSLSTSGRNDPHYLEYVHKDDGGLFIAEGDQFLSALSRLELVNAGNGLVHIRCCYNNKYLAIRSEDDHRVSAVANEPVEDQSSWSCTMFELTMRTPSGGLQRVRFTHVNIGRRLHAPPPDRVLQVAPPDFTGQFFVHDISSFLALKLPQFVVFKANNNNYVRVVTGSGTSPHLTCGTAGGALNVNAMHEILPPADSLGSIRIRSLANNSCWRMHRDGPQATPQEPWTLIIADSASNQLDLSPNHIWTDGLFTAESLPSNSDVNKISLTLVPARSPPWYLQRVPNQLLGYLPRDQTALHPEAEFVVEEAVRSRKIYNVRYNAGAARLLPGHPSDIDSQTVDNETSSDTNSLSRTFTYTERRTTSWNAQFSLSYGISATLTAKVPFFSEGSLTTSWEFTAAYVMGSERTTEETKADTIHVIVPPWTKTTVTRWESEGSVDVPFSYTQEDILLTGVMRRLEKHDGIAIGVNNHAIFYRITEEPIGSSTSEPREYVIVPSSSRIVSSSAPVG